MGAVVYTWVRYPVSAKLKWKKLQCSGEGPDRRHGHTAVMIYGQVNKYLTSCLSKKLKKRVRVKEKRALARFVPHQERKVSRRSLILIYSLSFPFPAHNFWRNGWPEGFWWCLHITDTCCLEAPPPRNDRQVTKLLQLKHRNVSFGMGVVLQLVCRTLSPLFLAVRSLLSSCKTGKIRKTFKEHREKYIFKHSGSYSLLQCKADCSYLNFFRNRRTVVISVQVCLLLLLWWWW